ncbi:MAG: hypothetical protein M3O23_11250, partial [Actinomycetota bacterium]|nr:hypothetical protein [Actinomycetota bacterium]
MGCYLRRSGRGKQAAHGPLQAVADRVQPPLPVDQIDEVLPRHAVLLSPYAPHDRVCSARSPPGMPLSGTAIWPG